MQPCTAAFFASQDQAAEQVTQMELERTNDALAMLDEFINQSWVSGILTDFVRINEMWECANRQAIISQRSAHLQRSSAQQPRDSFLNIFPESYVSAFSAPFVMLESGLQKIDTAVNKVFARAMAYGSSLFDGKIPALEMVSVPVVFYVISSLLALQKDLARYQASLQHRLSSDPHPRNCSEIFQDWLEAKSSDYKQTNAALIARNPEAKKLIDSLSSFLLPRTSSETSTISSGAGAGAASTGTSGSSADGDAPTSGLRFRHPGN